MKKIVFEHSDAEGKAHRDLRDSLARDTKRFLQSGKKITAVAFGVSGERDAMPKGKPAPTAIKHVRGTDLTVVQNQILNSIADLSAKSGGSSTYAGLRNNLKTVQNKIISEQLKVLQNMGYVRVSENGIRLINPEKCEA